MSDYAREYTFHDDITELPESERNFRHTRLADGRMVAAGAAPASFAKSPHAAIFARWAGEPPALAGQLRPVDFPANGQPTNGGTAALDAWGRWVVRSGRQLLWVDHPDLTYDLATRAAGDEWQLRSRSPSLEQRMSGIELGTGAQGHRRRSSSNTSLVKAATHGAGRQGSLPPGQPNLPPLTQVRDGNRITSSTSASNMMAIEEESDSHRGDREGTLQRLTGYPNSPSPRTLYSRQEQQDRNYARFIKKEQDANDKRQEEGKKHSKY